MRWREEEGWGSTTTLAQLREEVTGMDFMILNLVKKRMVVCQEIGAFKVAAGLPIRDSEQEGKVIETRVREGQALGLEADFVSELLMLLMKHSRRLQQCIQR